MELVITPCSLSWDKTGRKGGGKSGVQRIAGHGGIRGVGTMVIEFHLTKLRVV